MRCVICNKAIHKWETRSYWRSPTGFTHYGCKNCNDEFDKWIDNTAEQLRQALYRALGLRFDSDGRGYWTRGRARLQQLGLAIPDPPRRFPLTVLDFGRFVV